MNRLFSQRRDRLLTYQAMREGKTASSRRVSCPGCGEESGALDWSRNGQVCPRCGYHGSIGAYYRLSMILDPGSFRELEEKLSPADPLAFPGYPQKLAALEEDFLFSFWSKPDGNHTAVRVCTSWATESRAVQELIRALDRWDGT